MERVKVCRYPEMLQATEISSEKQGMIEGIAAQCCVLNRRRATLLQAALPT